MLALGSWGSWLRWSQAACLSLCSLGMAVKCSRSEGLYLLSRDERSLLPAQRWVRPSAVPTTGTHDRGGTASQRPIFQLHRPPSDQRPARGLRVHLALLQLRLHPVHR